MKPSLNLSLSEQPVGDTLSLATMSVISFCIILVLEVNRRGSKIRRGWWGLKLIQGNKSTHSISAEHPLFSVQQQHIGTLERDQHEVSSRNIPEEGIFHSHSCENLKSYWLRSVAET
jgi:hypothetical protein